jgi:CBS domain-containing protein
MIIGALLDERRDPIPLVTPESPLAEAARLLASRRTGAVPVADAAGRVLGLVGEAEIIRIVAERAAGIRGLAVEEAMRRGVPVLDPAMPVSAALDLMRQSDSGALPVCAADGRLLGVVTLRDLMAWRQVH